jgi:hypothetical protein
LIIDTPLRAITPADAIMLLMPLIDITLILIIDAISLIRHY